MTDSAIVFASTVAVGHVRPLIPFARRCVERGFTVIWAISGDANEPAAAWRAPLSELGITFVDVDETTPFRRGNDPELAGFVVSRRIIGRANDVAEGGAAAIAAALAGRRVVLGVYDFFAVWAYVAMRRLGVERISTVITGFPTALDELSVFGDDPVYERELARLRASLPGVLDEPLRGSLVPRDAALRVVSFTSRSLCLHPPEGVEILGITHEALPRKSELSSAREEDRSLALRLRDARDRGAHVVLLSLGTVLIRMFTRMGGAHVAFLRRLYSTLAAAALRAGAVVVVSTSESSAADVGVDEAALGPDARDRVIALPFVPQPLLFAHGLVDVMLTHGGANTFHETAASGIPLLISPGFGDQPAVARAAAELGTGVSVEAIMQPRLEGAVSVERVAAEVLPEILAPGVSRWKTAAMRVASEIARDDGVGAAERLLL